ncbi:MAG: glycosyltransferase [Candidatus Omnitrophota bacterium]|nr:glycosyltransferase [Candidatus Omnitrophota bacterium]
MNTKLSIAIPTYDREEVLLDTIKSILNQLDNIEEIFVVDQTKKHTAEVEAKLRAWHDNKSIRWIRLDKPSVTHAFNKGLLEASSDIVLFLDDDIVPSDSLVINHLRAHSKSDEIWAVTGKIVQPEGAKAWAKEKKQDNTLNFRFDSSEERYIENLMAGNLSVKRDKALEIGGFDENFIGAAFRFETEFAERLILSGGKILYAPDAMIKHLRASEGGVRAYGDLRLTASPMHAVGAYYYLLRSRRVTNRIFRCSKRLAGSIYSEQHLKKPWWIILTIFAEITALLLAFMLYMKGPRVMQNTSLYKRGKR